MLTRCLQDAHPLAAEAANDLANAFAHALAVPALASVPTLDGAVIVPNDRVILGLGITRVADQGDTLVDRDNVGVELGRSLDVEVENSRSRLIADEEQILMREQGQGQISGRAKRGDGGGACVPRSPL